MKKAIILCPRKNKFHKHAKNHGLTLSVIRIIPIILDDRKNLVLRIYAFDSIASISTLHTILSPQSKSLSTPFDSFVSLDSKHISLTTTIQALV